MAGSALVTIGIPTYNAAATIEGTLRAVLAQDHERVEIIISDNASTDDTVVICRKIVGNDPRARIVAHEHNHGWQYNFRYLLAEATGPYFMWVGADDRPAPSFARQTAAMLDGDRALVSSVSRVRWLHDGTPGELAAGTAPLGGSPRQNVAAYVRHARDNSRFYGLHRTEALRDSFPTQDFYGLDLAIMIGTLRHGGHGEVPQVLLERERNDPAGYVRHIDADATGLADRLIPLRRLTWSIVSELKAPMSARSLWWLGVRNAFEHLRYWSTSDGLYGKVAGALFARLEQRRADVSRLDDVDSRSELR